MSGYQPLTPTPRRLRLCAAIAAEQVSGYPGWRTPLIQASDAGLAVRTVTADARKLIAAKLADWEPEWRHGQHDRGRVQDRYQLELTDAGKAWRAKHAEVETVEPRGGAL
jgi:hypothetical protein